MYGFNQQRSVFPAYSGLNAVRVQWPTPPNRSAMARNVKDLWDIHISEPHVTHDLGPGSAVPLPDENGYDPNLLSEDSPQNILANRGSTPIDSETREAIQATLQEVYTAQLEKAMLSSNESLFDLKKDALHNCPGALLIYNGASKELLLQAMALCETLEQGATAWVSKSAFSIDAKEQYIAYIKTSPEARQILLVPDPTLTQKVIGNTQSYNNLKSTLSVLGISSDLTDLVDQDDQFSDHRTAITRLKLRRNIGARNRLITGDLAACFESVRRQLPRFVSSKECAELALKVLNRAIALTQKRQLQDLTKLNNVMEMLEQEMMNAGVDTMLLPKLQREKGGLVEAERQARAKIKLRLPRNALPSRRGAADGHKSVRKIHNITQNITPSNAGLITEMCLLLCIKDVLEAKCRGIDGTEQCANRLAAALDDVVLQSPDQLTTSLQHQVGDAQQHLTAAQIKVSKENLDKSIMSDTRKALMNQWLGA